MEDEDIVQLFWLRDEQAITAVKEKYGSYLLQLALRVLGQVEDSEECVNDSYLAAWNTIPPQRPSMLQAYLAKITRRISIDRYRHMSAAKRGGGVTVPSIEELGECIPSPHSVETEVELGDLRDAITRFLRSQPTDCRRAFLMRYWYSLSIREIAGYLNCPQAKIAKLLSKTRKNLKAFLESEGLFYG